MKITAQLALSQIKLNRKRTIGSIFAISLSTALITVVMCFVTSGNQMLIDFLGEDYGSYGGAYLLMLAIPVLICTLLVFGMSVTVISNIFTASANKRIQEFGILKCVGGTRKQIRESVIYESLWLSMIGIPLGLLLGTLIGWIGVTIAGRYVSYINELSKSIIMRPYTFSLSFHVALWTYAIAAVFAFFVVICSAGKPAKTVGKITAIECIRGLGANRELKSVVVKDRWMETLFGCESALAFKNIKRNKSGYQASIRALSLGILLLLLTGGLAGQARQLEDWMNPDSKEMNVDYCSIRKIGKNPVTGKEEEKIAMPISARTYNEITEKLSQYPDIEVYGVGSDACTYHALLHAENFSDEMKKVSDIIDKNGETKVSLVSVDERLYRELCERAGAAYGSNLLINASNEKTEVTIGGMLHEDDLIEKGFHEQLPRPVRIVMPDIDARYFDWFCEPDDEQSYTQYARNVMDAYYPILTEDSYVEQGYTVRIARVDNMAKILNVSIVLVKTVMYGFVLLLLVMGFTSVFTSLSTNLRIRSREFAVLGSIGMTNASLRKMIYMESLICILKASVSGIAFGIAIPYAINLSIRNIFPVRYNVPWETFVIGMFVLISSVMLLTYMEVNQRKGKSIKQSTKSRDVLANKSIAYITQSACSIRIISDSPRMIDLILSFGVEYTLFST